jgi:hypothetical protein
MYEVLEAIYVFFNASTKRSKVLVDLLKEVENALQLRNLSKTRWTVRPESVEALWRSFETVVEALRALNCSENVDPDTKTKASGLLGRMLRFDFIVSLMFAKNVFIKTKMMTKVLERETLDVTGAIKALKVTGENIQRIRESDTEVNDLVDASVLFASNLNVDAVSEYQRYHRSRRLPRRLDERQNTTAEMEMPEFYRKEFHLVLDMLLLQIQEKTEKIKSAFKPLLEGLCPTQLPTYEQIEKLCQMYPIDLPHPLLLFAECEMFIPYLHEHSKRDGNISDITYRYAADLALRQSHIGLFPFLAKAYRFCLPQLLQYAKMREASVSSSLSSHAAEILWEIKGWTPLCFWHVRKILPKRLISETLRKCGPELNTGALNWRNCPVLSLGKDMLAKVLF